MFRNDADQNEYFPPENVFLIILFINTRFVTIIIAIYFRFRTECAQFT